MVSNETVAESSPQNLKVLIVEDSPLIIARLKKAVKGLPQIEITGTVKNITGAMQQMQENKPDVVILDIYLSDDAPIANGITLLARMAKDHPEVEVIMLSNLSGPLYRSKCLHLGASYFFDKSNEFEKVPDTLVELKKIKNIQKQ